MLTSVFNIMESSGNEFKSQESLKFLINTPWQALKKSNNK